MKSSVRKRKITGKSRKASSVASRSSRASLASRASHASPAIKRHAHMIGDMRRTGPLLQAIAQAVRPGDSVLDIGTGLGLCAIAAAKAGACQIFAIDCDSQALEVAEKRAIKEGVAEKISFIEGLSFDLDLPGRVDLILCETIGSFAFDENILVTLADAKQRFLRHDGRTIPGRLELWGAPCRCLPKVRPPAEIAIVKKDDLLGSPALLEAIDFHLHIPESISIEHCIKCEKAGTIRSIAVWPHVTWWKDEITDASPLKPKTHWMQGILPIEEKKVAAGEEVKIELIFEPHPDYPKTMTERMWRWR